MDFLINGHNILVIVLVTFVISVICVAISKRVAHHIGAVDKTGEESFRRLHKDVLPRLGGLGMFAAFLVGYMLYGEINAQMVSVIIGAFVLVIVGMFDDIKTMRQRFKLISHILAALILVFYGNLVLDKIDMFGITLNFPMPLNYIFTIFFIVGCINAINFIDGMDGLSSGISSIYFLTIGIIALIVNNFGGLDIILSFIMLGSVLGFLFHNFPPAKIIAGDCGSQFMGYMIAVIALIGFKGATLTSLVIPLVILAIPIFDTAFAIFRRLLRGQRINEGDRDHLHHQLLNMKFSTKKSVLIVYAINILFAAVSIFYVLGDTRIAIVLYVALMVIAIFFVMKTDILFDHKKKEKKK